MALVIFLTLSINMFRLSSCTIVDRDFGSGLPVFGIGWPIGGEYQTM